MGGKYLEEADILGMQESCRKNYVPRENNTCAAGVGKTNPVGYHTTYLIKDLKHCEIRHNPFLLKHEAGNKLEKIKTPRQLPIYVS